MCRTGLLALVCVTAAGIAVAGDGAAKFTSGPKVTPEKDGVKIKFAVDRATDVAVEVLDAKGETVRHLAAGVLGENAPEPLKKGDLAQVLVWDRKDDLGQVVPAGTYSVRVGLGLAPHLKKVENFAPVNFGSVLGLAPMREGGVCIFGLGGYADFLPRLVVTDCESAYVREIFPPPANMNPEDCPSVKGFRRGDGRWVPMLGEVLPRPAGAPAFCPMAARGDRLYVVPFSAGPIRAFNVKTGAVSTPLGADLLGQGKGKIAPRAIAVGPDGKWLYLTGVEANAKDGKPLRPFHAVFRLPIDGSAGVRPFIGEPEKAGKDEALLNTPIGLACDQDGNVFVCDNGNDRVAVFSPQGKFVRSVNVKAPLFIAIHSASGVGSGYPPPPTVGDPQGTGGDGAGKTDRAPSTAALTLPHRGGGDSEIVALTGSAPAGAARTFGVTGLQLVRLSADGKAGAPENLAVPGTVKRACVTGLGLDTSKEPAVAWLSLSGEAWPASAGALLRYELRDAALAALAPVSTNFKKPQTKGPYDPRYLYNWGVNDSNYIKYQEAFDWNYLADEGAPFYSIGPLTKSGLWADGRMYAWNDWIWYHKKKADVSLIRLNPDKSPLPFPAFGTNALKLDYEPNAPWFAQRGTMVDRRGHIYVRYSWADPVATEQGLDPRNQWATGVVHFDETGALVGRIALTHGTYGMGVDVRGNIYVGDKPRPAGVMVPADIEKAFNGNAPQGISDWYGSVIKFGPAGGQFRFKKGKPAATEARRPGDLFRPPLKTMDADVGPWLRGGGQADLEGAEWVWVGMSPLVTTKACICYGTSFAVDPHGRVFAPDKMACRVAVLDANGNLIRYIGAYGNLDSRGKDSPVPDPDIAFALVRMVTSATSRQVRVADNGNGWVSVISLDYAHETKVHVTVGGGGKTAEQETTNSK